MDEEEEREHFLREATEFVYSLYPRYRGVKLAVPTLEALLKGYMSEVADQQHTSATRSAARRATVSAPPTPAHIHVWAEDHWETHHVRIA